MRYATAILVLWLACLTGCVNERNADYLPATDQVFLIPMDSTITAAPGTVIITDGPSGKVDLDTITMPYDGVLLSRGYFLLLVRMAGEAPAP